jgi:hypothetical protein
MSIENTISEAFARDCLYGEISDTFKDIHGIRPRWIDPAQMSIDELAALRDRLVLELGHAINEAREIARAERIERKRARAEDRAAQDFYRRPIPLATFAQLIGRA